MKLAAAVLAAGRSLRFGDQKITAELCGKRMVCYPVEDLRRASIETILVILNPETSKKDMSCIYGARKVVNYNYMEGMASSIRLSVDIVRDDFTHLLITNGDMPLFGWKHYAEMVCLLRKNSTRIISAYNSGILRSPAIFPKEYFDELFSLHGEDGGRSVLNRHKQETIPYEISDTNDLMDIDTQDDLERASIILCERGIYKM